MRTVQIEDAVRIFCVIATRDGVEATGKVAYNILTDESASWEATFYGRIRGRGDIVASACGIEGKSPGDALINAARKYSERLDAYLAEQAEEAKAVVAAEVAQ